ncbi:MAG: RsmD family RNA methyltransferase [Bacteroidales bacterium]|nr:RsmD family RNA methyltransferase [Bacteroidales bacterium]
MKRRIIKPPAGLLVRPTTDKAKEGLFNILVNYIDFESISVLDLFAGTGSIALEFASRGATEVIAVDNNIRCVSFLRDVVIKHEINNMNVVRADALKFIKTSTRQFDVVFCDPPYHLQELESIPERIFQAGLLRPGAMLIMEHPGTVSFERHPEFIFKRNYSKVHFSFFEV